MAWLSYSERLILHIVGQINFHFLEDEDMLDKSTNFFILQAIGCINFPFDWIEEGLCGCDGNSR